MTFQLSQENVRKFEVPWNPSGIEASTSRANSQYMDRMAKEFSNVFTQRLETCIQSDADRADLNCQLYTEVVQHVHYCHQK